MFGLFKKKLPDDKEVLARLLLHVWERLKRWDGNAKLRVPYYLKIYLMRIGFDQNDLVDKKEDILPKFARDNPDIFDIEEQSN